MTAREKIEAAFYKPDGTREEMLAEMAELLESARIEALEEAAQVAETHSFGVPSTVGVSIAHAIRALKEGEFD